MSIVEGLTALAVILVFGWIIYVKILKKNPNAGETIRDFMEEKKIKRSPGDMRELVYTEKRMGM